jgi:hypothetical protein
VPEASEEQQKPYCRGDDYLCRPRRSNLPVDVLGIAATLGR